MTKVVKDILIYLVVFTLIGTSSYFISTSVLPGLGGDFGNILKKAFSFHFFFSFFLVTLFDITSKRRIFYNQLGFVYLAAFIAKLAFFATLFYPFIFGDKLLPLYQRAILLIPLFVFLFLEVFFIAKIMNRENL